MNLQPDEIRRQQREALRQHETALMQALRQSANLDAAQWPDTVLLPHTQRGLDRAVVHGLSTQPDILSFLTFRHLFGERFDEFPAVRDFLARQDLPTANRVQLMMLELPFAIWDIVKRRTPAGPSPSGIETGKP